VKIVQVCPRYCPDIGGVETHVREISERLVRKGFEVEVVCTDPTGRSSRHEMINGVEITRFRSFAPDDAYYFAPQIYFYLKSRSYTLIHAHSYHALPALFAALAADGHKLIFTPHYHRGGHTPVRDFLHKIYRSFGSKIFDRADKVVCVSEYEQRLVMSDFDMPEWKIEKIPNGLNLAEFANLKPERNGRTLLYVGRLEEYKGVQYIISALPRLEDFKLEIIGKGPYENDLRKLADELGVSERINWQSGVTREELLQHYASADVFLMLSTHEAYGITVAEALAARVPCVVARGSALTEFVDGTRCIGIETPITVDKLVEAIQRLNGVGWNIKNLPISISDWDDITDRLIDVYEGV